MKLKKFWIPIYIMQRTINNVSKTLSSIKIHTRRPEKSLIECRKMCEIDWKQYCFISFLFDVNFMRFHTFFDIQSKISPASVKISKERIKRVCVCLYFSPLLTVRIELIACVWFLFGSYELFGNVVREFKRFK
jgi:hypothetical protein